MLLKARQQNQLALAQAQRPELYAHNYERNGSSPRNLSRGLFFFLIIK